MKLIKKVEAEIMQVYNAYWDNYLKGDVAAMDSLLGDEYTQVGSAEDEVFSNKKVAVQFLYDTIDQVAGKLDMRNREIAVEPQDNAVLIREFCDLYALSGTNWIFYSRFRASTLMQEKKDGWKIIHQHSSFPDTKTEAGQNIAIDKIAEENQQLREAVRRRTIELEQKNRELEIEAALERIRSKAMSMHKSDDLQAVVETVFKELDRLNMGLIRCGIAILDKEKPRGDIWITIKSNQGSTIQVSGDEPLDIHPLLKGAYDAWVQQEDFSYVLHNDDLLSYYQVITKASFQLPFAESFNSEHGDRPQYYFNAVFPHGSLFAFLDCAFTDESKRVMKRFANVFNLTYKRFLDLQKAEAQTREAQIELALEMVRTRSLAMHKSDELQEVVHTVFKKLKELDVELYTAIIFIFTEGTKDIVWWLENRVNQQYPRILVPYVDNPYLRDIFEAKETGRDFFSATYSFEEKNDLFHHLFENTDFRNVPETQKEFLLKSELATMSVALAKNTGINITSYTKKSFSEKENEILQRFAKVFDQAYTRFLDLQKAEAQAREAQIELGLERVRARTMAMQRSDELANVATVLFQQVKALGVSQWVCGFSIFDIGDKEFTWYPGSAEGEILPPAKVPLTEHPVFISYIESKKRGDELFVYEKEGEFQAGHYRYMQSLPGMGGLLQKMLDAGHSIPTFQIDHIANFSHGNLVFITYEHVPEMHVVFKRFAKVFEQTYTRFLDLQKAEAQAREAQIELGLERVRARAMAMQKSEELSSLVAILFEELTKLNLILVRCIIWIFDADTQAARVWMANSEDKKNADSYFIRRLNHPYYDAILQGWKQRTHKWVYDLQGEEKKSIDTLLFHETELAQLPAAVKTGILSSTHTIVSGSFNNFGFIEASGPVPQTEEQLEILHRFANVFDQTYTRFLDLQKAEANAREAQIEAGLERVRAQTMAMHNSEDVSLATATMFTELEKLGVENVRGGFTHIRENQTQEVWSINTLPDGTFIRAIGEFDMTMHPFWQQLYAGWQNKDDFFSFRMSGKDKEDYVKILNARPDYLPNGIQHFPDSIAQVYYFGEGGIWTFSLQPHSEENKQVMKKFASVFSLTYRRYQDLKKAEAQAREAQIEAALERVRSKAMAMHNSRDLAETIKTFYYQVETLSTIPRRLGIGIIDKESHCVQLTTMNTTAQGDSIEIMGTLSLTGHPVLEGIYTYWLAQKEYRPVLDADEISDYYKIVRPQISYPDYPANAKQFGYFFFFPEGGVYAWTDNEMAEEDLQIYRRFTSVLSLTYRRFKDLKEAEAQTRLAQIETAMEKVRARALAMQQPGELVEVANVLRKEMGLLGVEELETCSIYLLPDGVENTEGWYSIKDEKGTEEKAENNQVVLQLGDTRVGRQMLEFYLSDKTKVSIPITGEDMQEWVRYTTNHSPALEAVYGDQVPGGFYHLHKFSSGYIGAASAGPLSNESWDLLQRATAVFSLAYTRYSDLQKSAANAREALRQAALDRVRAEIASMRTVSDLEKITPLIWNELTILGVPFIRCGVFIMDESRQMIQTFLATPDGKAIAAFHIPYQTPGNIGQVLDHWRRKKVYIDHWDESAFNQFAATLVKQGALISAELYLKTIPHGGFHLHFLPFLQGMLYVGNTDPLAEEELKLIQSVADAFSTAYARYEDFNKLELAKQQIENTLQDLKLAQTQLVQSEKMASLGELTAGIAHEIQNPLNFVNNFSEINTELIDELEQEARKGNYAEVQAIAKDIRENEQKINHHGKRADAIVKGMLQHSRSRNNVKEMTDVNKLADEYLRLAYHGWRAKDKSFNATLNTDYDEHIGLINVIPQDIGRVILNLINNAFYAVDVKSKSGLENYEPAITLSTSKNIGVVEVRVRDNGIGMSPKVLDKIFQPFFTTKPTGQGTGLGLSLAYDIIKAHGGELRVESAEGKGSVFTISLNVSAIGS